MRGRFSGQLFIFARRLWRMIPEQLRVRFWSRWGNVVPYQKMIYKGKVLAWGHDRTPAYRVIFPSAPTGKTILDVGCHTGFYCLMAASEGAEYCEGIDIEQRRINNARLLTKKVGITNVTFIAADIFEYEPARRFDVVLCLNLLQHMGTSDRANQLLDKLYSLAKTQLILIVPLPDAPMVTCEYAVRNKITYLLLSKEYFKNKYSKDCTLCLPLDPSYYGANRAAIIISKTELSAER
jgi:2-polyprenyl-3-methyl-5-hydroxy-6-metoxy-1,4-benzoquinol methylase